MGKELIGQEVFDLKSGFIAMVIDFDEEKNMYALTKHGHVEWRSPSQIKAIPTRNEKTLRDEFAMASIDVAAKFVFDGYCGEPESETETIAIVAYELADKMLEARKVKHD